MTDAVGLVESFRTAQNRGDVAACVGMLAADAVFDIGTGRFEGPGRIATLLRLLARIHYTTAGEPAAPGEGRLLTALWTVQHDDLRRSRLGELQVHAEIEVREGAIVLVRTRPTAETLAKLRAASGTTDPAAYEDSGERRDP